ncbi:hypothetical protein QWZ03_01220 [Chitinimonas viridis]|uniref:Uncharacterized protein n=1 Tax=Chitinimonas viridis TaxID=664880 RepID=A0ABT8AZI7_9NEIS|nr:hypothetical protein [Chitinimonas viridis]MDN3575393.1 hypothetical protein [Chitinimonas viridis]
MSALALQLPMESGDAACALCAMLEQFLCLCHIAVSETTLTRYLGKQNALGAAAGYRQALNAPIIWFYCGIGK